MNQDCGWFSFSFQIQSSLLGLWQHARLSLNPRLSLVRITRKAKTQLAKLEELLLSGDELILLRTRKIYKIRNYESFSGLLPVAQPVPMAKPQSSQPIKQIPFERIMLKDIWMLHQHGLCTKDATIASNIKQNLFSNHQQAGVKQQLLLPLYLSSQFLAPISAKNKLQRFMEFVLFLQLQFFSSGQFYTSTCQHTAHFNNGITTTLSTQHQSILFTCSHPDYHIQADLKITITNKQNVLIEPAGQMMLTYRDGTELVCQGFLGYRIREQKNLLMLNLQGKSQFWAGGGMEQGEIVGDCESGINLQVVNDKLKTSSKGQCIGFHLLTWNGHTSVDLLFQQFPIHKADFSF